MDAPMSLRQDYWSRSANRHAWHGECPLPLAGESRPWEDAEQALGDLARLLPCIASGYERGRFLCQRAPWRHGNVEEWYNDRAGPFFRQPGVSLHGWRRGDPGHARSRVAPCYFAHALRQKL